MKKTKIGILFFVLVASITLLAHSFFSSSSVVTPRPITQQQTAGIPILLTISTLHVSAPIEHVGLDAQKRMDVPKGIGNVGWYDLGTRPGDRGSAVIDGHYDTPTGAPAIFYNISKLQKGDKVMVTDENGKNHTFVVSDNLTYAYDKLPLQKIFTQSDKPRLNLITCGGTWDKGSHNYSERNVVYAVEE